MRVIGIDLAWSEGSDRKEANETGIVAVDPSGRVVDAGWACGLRETTDWIENVATPDTILMVDAPLVVSNATGQRLCETQVGQRYGRWKVSANSTNLSSPRLAGVALIRALELAGWTYHDGRGGPPSSSGRYLAEVYPYTTLVGSPHFGYDVERPIYKRRPKSIPAATFRTLRAANCDELVRRLVMLSSADPPLDLMSHPVTRALADEGSPVSDRPYKHREDLIDAVVAAWTGLLWMAYGFEQCQVLGANDVGAPVATIIAPARPEQRGSTSPTRTPIAR